MLFWCSCLCLAHYLAAQPGAAPNGNVVPSLTPSLHFLLSLLSSNLNTWRFYDGPGALPYPPDKDFR